MKFKEYDDKNFMVKKIKPKKVKVMNPKTNRMKTSRRSEYIKTDVPMERRTLKNLPRYADKKAKVHFKDWMGIKGQKTQSNHSAESIGKSEADGAWYGWSHRAISGFKVGDCVKSDTCGNTSGKEYTIKNDNQARDAAIAFAKDVS